MRALLVAAVAHAACDFAPPALSVAMLKRLGEFKRGAASAGGAPILYRKNSKTACWCSLLSHWRSTFRVLGKRALGEQKADASD